MDSMHFFLGFLISLFVIADPFGMVPVFLSLSEGAEQKWCNKQARKCAINVFVLMTIFFLAGSWVLEFFGFTVHAVELAGGLIVGSIGWSCMNPKPTLSEKEHSECRERDDISFVPLAMPIIAGPGAIAVLLTNASHLHSDGKSVYFWGLGMLAVLIVAITTWACFRCATIVHTCLGASGLKAMTRIVGFILICIAAQMMIDGVVGLIHEHFPDVTEVLG
jgi:multiple antibiotic resistance protein